MSRTNAAYFSSGYLPVRAPGLDRRLPTWGTGEYEWQGFLELVAHPHAAEAPSGRMLNWNNQNAPGFMHGDNEPYGSVHRGEWDSGAPESWSGTQASSSTAEDSQGRLGGGRFPKIALL